MVEQPAMTSNPANINPNALPAFMIVLRLFSRHRLSLGETPYLAQVFLGPHTHADTGPHGNAACGRL
jgi:hypothetical protein